LAGDPWNGRSFFGRDEKEMMTAKVVVFAEGMAFAELS
jgi:hypothetical protein